MIAAQFAAALNEGDVFDTSTDAANNVTCMITDQTVSGTVTVVDTPGAEYFQIGNLGDDFASTNNDTFVASMAKFDNGELVINVDGEPITDYADFAGVLSNGDQAEYSRASNIETVSLTNGLPTTISGQAVDDGAPADLSDGFDIATNPGVESIDAPSDPDARFIINGILGTEGDYEDALTAGDDVSYTPEDTAGGTPETFTVTDQDLAGPVDETTINVGTSYDVLSSEGDATLATVTYGAVTDRYFIDGEEVDIADFDAALTDIDMGDATGDVTVVETALATEHRLTVTEV